MIKGLYVGKGEEIGGSSSAFRKRPVDGVRVLENGLEGDERMASVHQDEERGILHVDLSSKDRIARELGLEWKTAAHLGQNLDTNDADFCEEHVCIGDRYAVGDELVLEVAIPRYTCKRNDMVHDAPGLRDFLLKDGHAGWFYRVVRPGSINVGQELVLIDRPNPRYSVMTVYEALHVPSSPLFNDVAVLKDLAEMDALGDRLFRGLAKSRLEMLN